MAARHRHARPAPIWQTQQIANHESPRTTKLYDRTNELIQDDAIILDEIECIIQDQHRFASVRRNTMTIKCSVYIAASVDGFIATPEGGMEWLERPEYSATPMRGLSYKEFISTVDGFVMGRKTFEKVLTFGSWPYEGTPVVVLSSRGITVPAHLADAVRLELGTPQEILERLAKAGMRHLYIDGGVTIQRFLEAKLINEITITRIPVLLGTGLSLFGNTGTEQKLKLLEAVASDNGFVQERYKIESAT